MALTAKQQCFVAEYLIDLNATQAATRAGYKFAEAVSFYTYLLIDPRDGRVFYVGKGKGARMASHAKRAAAGKVDNAEKHKRISEIRAAGMKVSELVFAAYGNEQDAFAAECELIEQFRDHGITNIVGGVVTNAERAREQAKVILGRMKTFDHWMETIRPYQLDAVTKLGGARKFYDDSLAFWKRMAELPVSNGDRNGC
jgi:hypothetical protein